MPTALRGMQDGPNSNAICMIGLCLYKSQKGASATYSKVPVFGGSPTGPEPSSPSELSELPFSSKPHFNMSFSFLRSGDPSGRLLIRL